MLKKKHILIGVSGGIAAYKTPLLVREFRKAGAEVRVVMTEAAKEFVTPLTLSTLSGNDVISGMFPASLSGGLQSGTWHVGIGRWADVMLIAPATANVIAQLAHGAAENAVTTVALAARCPVIVAPAMDADMWLHPSTRANIEAIRSLGYRVIPPAEGELASGLHGVGRLPEPAEIFARVEGFIGAAQRDLRGMKILISAGPTREPLDPVRYFGNRSSGKMGFALAAAAAQRGADVTLVTGPVSLPTPPHVGRTDVATAAEMYEAVMSRRRGKNAIIMAAAVADFTPARPSSVKIKKDRPKGAPLTVELLPTRDILAALGKGKGKTILVGFALETHDELSYAKNKLREKNLDMIVSNNPMRKGSGFGTDTNRITIIARRGKPDRLPLMTKFDAADRILDRIAALAGR
ncbi:MAG TPA: bifunctional phosphopantothenoylcysteine decarboxylase/phosphopantothenate--cysteine ligase CoaBC [Bacteroidota bacterium]|nr:bifunctional phosphopantothenoylcysteine decarboxylase/phosphopantothenate--cysteine ligase CoaBC [Bacteroidota bacterium]